MFPGRQMIRNRMDIMNIVSGDGLLCSSQWQGTLSMSSGYASLMNVYTVAVESSSSTPAAISMPHASKAVVELLNCSKIFYCSLNTCSNINKASTFYLHIIWLIFLPQLLQFAETHNQRCKARCVVCRHLAQGTNFELQPAYCKSCCVDVQVLFMLQCSVLFQNSILLIWHCTAHKMSYY